jgi:Raf kinase inhibitor-like YbhB/YbcL family protein
MTSYQAARATAIGALALMVSVAARASDFVLTSPDLGSVPGFPAQHVLDGFGCSGQNRSPELKWSPPPAGTQSLAVTLYDPDAPTGSGWWHWTVFDIPPAVRGLAEGAGNDRGPLPAGAKQGRTDFGSVGYGGPCPPVGPAHRYVFTVWALKTKTLSLDGSASGALVGFMLNAAVIDKASLTVDYGRQR